MLQYISGEKQFELLSFDNTRGNLGGLSCTLDTGFFGGETIRAVMILDDAGVCYRPTSNQYQYFRCTTNMITHAKNVTFLKCRIKKKKNV